MAEQSKDAMDQGAFLEGAMDGASDRSWGDGSASKL
jgi:hypothetical protein